MKHDNKTDFISENREAIQRIATIIGEAYALLNELRGVNAEDMYNFVTNHERIKNIVSPSTLIIFKNMSGTTVTSNPLIRLRGIANSSSTDVMYYLDNIMDQFHVYGNMKTGERAKLELMSDLNNSLVFDEVLQRQAFNLDNHIQVGIDLSKIIDTDDVFRSPYLKIDIDALLVRYFQSEEYFNNANEINNALFASFFNRVIIFAYGHATLSRLINNLSIILDVTLEDGKRKHNLNDVLKFLLIYKNWYNIVNGLDDSDMEKSTLDIIDKCDGADLLFTKANGVQQAFMLLHNKLMQANMDVPRYPDLVIQKLLDKGRIATSTYVRTRYQKAKRADLVGYDLKTYKALLSVESLGFEETLRDLGYSDESIKELDNTKALFSMMGIESLASKTSFEEFKKKNRGMILAKLNQKERKIYLGLESDVLRLKAEAQAVTTTSGQQNVLRKCESVGKMILFEMNASTNDDFITILSALDSERYDIQTSLASRDIIKERNTKLYGQDITRRDWNY